MLLPPPLLVNSESLLFSLHVLSGDHPAAMYHEHRSSAAIPYRDSWCPAATVLLCSILANLLPFVFIMCSFNSSHRSSRRPISVDAGTTTTITNNNATNSDGSASSSSSSNVALGGTASNCRALNQRRRIEATN